MENIINDLSEEGVVGLMASDSTGWQDIHIKENKDFEASIIWNSKKPTGRNRTLEYLNCIIDKGESFPLFYSIKSKVCYRAEIIDFAINQEELNSKSWNDTYSIGYYESEFCDYSDDNKKASIVFLVRSMDEISPINVKNFVFFDNSCAPRQDNISPIKVIPEEIIIQNKYSKTLIYPKVEQNHSKSLNQILYGPPGTGKTYNTINKAIKIIDPSFDLNQNRKEIKKKYQKLVEEGQIVFTTFHQSMCYEDFIEGIKPLEPKNEGDNICYKVVDGIFKNIAIEAAFSIAFEMKSKEFNEILDFPSRLDNYIQYVEEEIYNNRIVEIRTKTEKVVEIYEVSEHGNLYVRHKGSKVMHTVSRERLARLYKKLPDFSNRNISSNDISNVIGGCNTTVYWAVLNAILKFDKPTICDKKQRVYSLQEKKNIVQSLDINSYYNKIGKPFVLIIDEINRGNVSQIFGELITLLEEDKRAGCDEALEVVLPYSKEKFSVPKNLYIIGTMNTADRSVEALDAALRRRFSFIEMPPKPDIIKEKGKSKDGIIEGIDLSELLKVINMRIEKLLDKDHKIGHSYFLNLASIDDLKYAFQKNIIPLLQEYFFGDYGKIGLVLGGDFFDKEDTIGKDDIFADFNGYDKSMLNRPVYSFIDIENMNSEDFKKAINVLLKNTKE